MKNIHPVALIILDGFGYSPEKKYNAIAQAQMPYFNQWWHEYPHAVLKAAGTAVGLHDNMIGNSEVGHVTIGAGRIIEQPMKQWLDAIDNGSFEKNVVLQSNFEKLKDVGGTLHIIGLLSDAGVHGHEKQIYASIAAAVDAGIKKIVVHPILDGRDVAPRSAYGYIEKLSQYIKQYNNSDKPHVIIGSLQGRFYAMDRDHNWDRVEKSYRMLTESHQDHESWEKVLEHNYMQGITDEFIPPTQLDASAEIGNGDGILFCNVRPDRARELTAAFVRPIEGFVVKPLNLTFFMTPVSYDDHLDTTILFPRELIGNTLKDVLAAHHKTIFAVAETEKYAHVTYFFRGENEQPVATEKRVLIPSMVVHDYSEHSCMSAENITHAVINSLRTNPADFYLINYANADMVGHSGNFDATVQAVECLDKQLKELYAVVVEKMNGTLCITADHGKAEDMYDEVLKQPRTAHTSNPVPFLMIKNGVKNDVLPLTQLSDIAPFILKNMGLQVPVEMQKE
ncbi:MAG TPA: 2,3-bisphosphoglycerate-independent phosphoglycerate mutase [Candidatus Babeliales bacterium]|nr:2,3-bisphosphoglycerate-independent phosphoglycerate mutase [Candidatus Babeliales bacterium]